MKPIAMFWRYPALLLMVVPLMSIADEALPQDQRPSSQWPMSYRFVAFEVPDTGLTVAGRLSFPESDPGDQQIPAVIIVHGSGGVDTRGPLYAKHLNQTGVATLEVDLWSARGLKGGLDRPQHVRDTLPDAFAALTYLQQHPGIDPERIGLMGFSWGGVIAMLAATEGAPAGDSPGFVSMAALYPVCWGYNRVPGYEFQQVQASQLMIISGAEDDYDAPDDCQQLLSNLDALQQPDIQLVQLPGATHAFDRRAPESLFFDPYAHRGQGGEVRIRYSPSATQTSLQRIGAFFSSTLIGARANSSADTANDDQSDDT